MSVIRYGMISLLALISVFHSSFSFSNSVHGASLTASEQLTDSSNIVVSGDGLYVDEYETGRYVYKGANPNNFIQFNDELWRIIAVEGDGTLKIRKDEGLGNMAWDTTGSNNWARPAT